MIVAKQVKALKTTHIGPEPRCQGSDARWRAGCRVHPQAPCRAHSLRQLGPRRLPHPTGVGTEVEKGKQKLTINGKEYLLELPHPW